jgi:hypothetical protein
MVRKSAPRLCAKLREAGRAGNDGLGPQQISGLGGNQGRRLSEKSIELMNETPTKINIAASSRKTITAFSPEDPQNRVQVCCQKRRICFQ